MFSWCFSHFASCFAACVFPQGWVLLHHTFCDFSSVRLTSLALACKEAFVIQQGGPPLDSRYSRSSVCGDSEEGLLRCCPQVIDHLPQEDPPGIISALFEGLLNTFLLRQTFNLRDWLFFWVDFIVLFFKTFLCMFVLLMVFMPLFCLRMPF